MNILKIAFRNLNRQKRRSVLLLLAVAFAFLVVSMIDGISRGAMKGMEHQLAKTFGGHIYVIGAEKSDDKKPEDEAEHFLSSTKAIDQALNDIGVKPLYTTSRTDISGTMIFEGKQARSRIVGCFFDKENLLRESITFVEGSWEAMKKENAILLSEGFTKEMKLQLHDIILLETKTSEGQAIVVEFQLEGIAKDKSALAQLSNYANLEYINKITQMPKGVFSTYNIFLDDIKMQESVASSLEAKLAEKNLVTNRAQAKTTTPKNPIQDLFRQLDFGKWKGTKYLVASMYDFAPQLTSMVNIVNYISLGILLILLAITMIGVSNTFKMIVHERKNEIGTMRSCGISRSGTKMLFITEGLLLSSFGAIIGLILGIIIMQIIAFIPVSPTSWVDIFCSNGHLQWILSPGALFAKFILMLLLSLFAVRGSASRAANMIPAEALRVGK